MSGSETLFTKIINREVPADIVYEDDFCLAFKDLNPQAPVHVLLIPKVIITCLGEVDGTQRSLLGHLMIKVPKIAKKLGIGDNFRLVVNNGEDAGSTVFHLHLHIMGGRKFTWPPG